MGGAGSAPGGVELALGILVAVGDGFRAGSELLRRGLGSVGWEGIGPRDFQSLHKEGRSQPRVVSQSPLLLTASASPGRFLLQVRRAAVGPRGWGPPWAPDLQQALLLIGK